MGTSLTTPKSLFKESPPANGLHPCRKTDGQARHLVDERQRVLSAGTCLLASLMQTF